MSTAYIVRNKKVVCSVDTELKGGTSVDYAYHRCENALMPSVKWSLVNSQEGVISRDKKYSKIYTEEFAIELYERNFYVS